MSRFTRGIFGQKPTAAGASDIIGLDTQYAATVSGTWPTTTSSTGFVGAEDFSYVDCGMISYSKKSDGLYYPGLFIESSPGASYTQFGAARGLSVAKGGTHVAVIVTTANPTVQDLFIWKNATYGTTSIWRYVTALTASNTSKYPNCVAFHPSGNYLVYGTYPAQNAGEQLYAFSRSGDTFTALSSPPSPSASACQVTAVEWNAAGTSLAVSINISPYIVIYNFSNGVFTKLAAPATLPTGYTVSLAWNPSGTSLAYQAYSTNAARIYNRSGDTFTAISGLPLPFLTNGTCLSGSMSWNSDGTLLAMTNFSGEAVVYYRSGDSFSPVSIPSQLISGSPGNQIQFNPSGKELLVTQNAGLDVWDVNGTSITRKSTSPFGAYVGRPGPGTSTYIYGSRMGTTYGSGDTFTVFTPTYYVRWIPPA